MHALRDFWHAPTPGRQTGAREAPDAGRQANEKLKWVQQEIAAKDRSSLQESGISKPGTSPLGHSGQVEKHEA